MLDRTAIGYRDPRTGPADDGAGCRAADFARVAGEVRIGRTGAVGDGRPAQGGAQRRAEARREDRSCPPGLRRRIRAGPLPRRARSHPASGRSRVSRAARQHPGPALLALLQGDDRAARSARDRRRGVAALHAVWVAHRRAARVGAGAGRDHGRLGPGAGDRRRGASWGPQGGRTEHRRTRQRAGLGLPTRARGPGAAH